MMRPPVLAVEAREMNSARSTTRRLLHSVRTTGSTAATTGALTLPIRTFILLVLACASWPLLSAASNTLLETHQGVTIECRLGHAIHKSLQTANQTVVTLNFALSASMFLSLLVSLRLRLLISCTLLATRRKARRKEYTRRQCCQRRAGFDLQDRVILVY